MEVHSSWHLMEEMSPGYVVECKLCYSSYMTWRLVLGADYCVVEFSVTAGTMRLAIACCDVSRCSWLECWEVTPHLKQVANKPPDDGPDD
jgi:hypothetical protein